MSVFINFDFFVITLDLDLETAAIGFFLNSVRALSGSIQNSYKEPFLGKTLCIRVCQVLLIVHPGKSVLLRMIYNNTKGPRGFPNGQIR